MTYLGSERLLRVWEGGQTASGLARPIALLAALLPEIRRRDLQRLPLGQREALLIQLRRQCMGPQSTGFLHCAECGSRLEFPIDLAAFPVAESLGQAAGSTSLEGPGWMVRLRQPNSRDLEAAGMASDIEEARRILLRGCVEEARVDGRPIEAENLPQEAQAAVARRLESLDPMADLLLEIDCGRCHHPWVGWFDIGEIFWQEVTQIAQRLADDVALLARAYGWSEREILGMSAARRRLYIDKVPAASEDDHV